MMISKLDIDSKHDLFYALWCAPCKEEISTYRKTNISMYGMRYARDVTKSLKDFPSKYYFVSVDNFLGGLEENVTAE